MYNSIEALQLAISQLCKERNITINKLADLSGLRQSTIDSIMKGKSNNPKILTLQKIAKGFDIEFNDFVTKLHSVQDEIEPKLPLVDWPSSSGVKKKISERVREIRLSKKLTLLDVCEATGLDFNFEYRAANSHETLIKLCQFFNVSSDFILGLTDEPKPLDGG